MSDSEKVIPIPQCAIHSLFSEQVTSDIKEIKGEQKDMREAMASFSKTLNDGIRNILVWTTILFASSTVSLIIFIVVTVLPGKVAP